MKRTLLTLLAATSLAAAAPAIASAQNINQRQENLSERIDRSAQRGFITRAEANLLINEYNGIVRLESQYRMNGLSQWERQDLDRRLDYLRSRIRDERRDNDVVNYPGSYQPAMNRLEQDIRRGFSNGDLTRAQHDYLMREVNALERREIDYRRNGLTVTERNDLQRRYDRLSNTVYAELMDDRRYGYGNPGYGNGWFGFGFR